MVMLLFSMYFMFLSGKWVVGITFMSCFLWAKLDYPCLKAFHSLHHEVEYKNIHRCWIP